MFLNRRGAGTAVGTPPAGATPTGPQSPRHPPAVAPLHGASTVGSGAMSLGHAVDTAMVEPRPAPYALMERVFDGLSAVRDVVGHMPPLGSVGEAEFVHGLCSAFQEFDLTRLIAQLHKLVSLRGDVDRQGLNRLEKALIAFNAAKHAVAAMLGEPDEAHSLAVARLSDAVAALQAELSGALASLEDRMTASLAIGDASMTTIRSGIEVPTDANLPQAIHHGIEGLQTILDKALAVKEGEGKFEAFMRLRRDLQEFDLFGLGEDLVHVKDVQPEILDLLTAIDIAARGWDGSFSTTLVEDRWDAIEAAIGKLAKALHTAGARAVPTEMVLEPQGEIDKRSGELARLLREVGEQLDLDSPVLQQIAERLSRPGSWDELCRLSPEGYPPSWETDLDRLLDRGSRSDARQLLSSMAQNLAEIGFIGWTEAMTYYVPERLDEWGRAFILREEPRPIAPKELAQRLGDALRALKDGGALGEANVAKMIAYLATILDGVDLRKLPRDPRLDDFHLLNHVERLGKLVAEVKKNGQTFRESLVKMETLRAEMRLIVRALVELGIIPEEIQAAFFAEDWPPVPGIAFEPFPPLPTTKSGAGALVGEAVRIGGLEPAVMHYVDHLILGIPDDSLLVGLTPQLEAIQGAVLLARHAGRPREHRDALLRAIEGLVSAIGGRAELAAFRTRGLEADLTRAGAPS